MVIAAAQIKPIDGNVQANLDEHYRFIQIAALHGVNFIVFPEMSITGYVREAARGLAFSPNDARLDGLRGMAAETGMTIVAGAPAAIGSQLHIGAFVIRPDCSLLLYTKQFLHGGEKDFFLPNVTYNPLIPLGAERISLAVCLDIEVPDHAQNAAVAGCTLYAAGIFFTPNGMEDAHRTLGEYASQHAMNVLMANYCGESWGISAGGKSAMWANDGRLVAELDSSDPGLVICRKDREGWTGIIVK